MELVAENINIMVPAVAAALAARDPHPLVALVRQGTERGVRIFDLNVGSQPRRAPGYMEFLLTAVFPRFPGLTVCLDSTSVAALDIGLQLAAEQRRPVILNALSLEEEKWERILPLAERYEQCRLVLLLMSPQIPLAAEERLSAVLDARERAVAAGIDPGRLIVDPVVVPLGWADGHLHSREILRFLQLLPEAVPETPATLIGLSNITTRSTGQRIRQEAEAVFLAMAATVNLNYAMVNIKHQAVLRTAGLVRTLRGEELFTPAGLEW